MILVCPECETHYELPVDLPEQGAKVRCTSCSHVWHATADDLLDETVLAAGEEEQADPDNIDGVDAQEVEAVSPLDEDLHEEIGFAEADTSESEPVADEGDEENSQDDIDGLFDDVGGGDEEAVEAISPMDNESLDDVGFEESEAGAANGGEENSQDDIDGLFDEPEPDDAGEENSQNDVDSLFDDPTPVDVEEPQAEAASEDEGFQEAPEREDTSAAPEPEINAEDESQTEIAVDTDLEPLPQGLFAEKQQVIGWTAYGLTVAIVLFVLIFARVSVVQTFPAMASVYAALGPHVNVRSLMFTNLQQNWVIDQDQVRLKVEGEILNMTNQFKKLPNVVFGARSGEDREIYRWVVAIREKPLLPGEKAVFSALMPPPPPLSEKLLVMFEK